MSSPHGIGLPPPRAGHAAVQGEDDSVPQIGHGGPDLAQIERDQDVLLAISVEGFNGPAWSNHLADIHDFGRRTLHQMIVSGRLPRNIASNLPEIPGAAENVRRWVRQTELTPCTRNDAVADALVRALGYWRRTVLPKKKWNPEGGAQLSTYFINLAQKRLYGVICKQLRVLVNEQAHDPQRNTGPLTVDRRETGPSPYQAIANADAARQRLDEIELSTTEAQIFHLVAQGIEYDEIATRTGLPTARAVEARIYRCRKRLAFEAA